MVHAPRMATRCNQHRDTLGRSRSGPTIACRPSPSVGRPSPSAARPSPSRHRANPHRASPKRADDRRQRHKRILVDNMSGRAKVSNQNHRRAPHNHSLGSTRMPRQDVKFRRWPTSSQPTASQQKPVCACEHSFCAIPAWIRMPPRAGAETPAEPRTWRRILCTAGRQLKDNAEGLSRSPWRSLTPGPTRLQRASSAQRWEHPMVSTRPRRWPRVRPRRSAWRASAPRPTLLTGRGCRTPLGT